jgi:hypothetical protein
LIIVEKHVIHTLLSVLIRQAHENINENINLIFHFKTGFNNKRWVAVSFAKTLGEGRS